MARNCGADHASGDAIMFLDADDVLAPDVLEHLIDELKKNPQGVVACPWYRLEKIGNKWVKRPPSCKPLGKNQDYLSGWLTGWYHLPCSILWSRTAYESMGGWDPRAYVNDDGDLMMRALADGINLQITDKGASFYRRMPEEQLTESLSGARFTRKGREAQIYVVHKIAQMLQDRGKISAYRKAVTQAFKRYCQLCLDEYPDLSERCNQLIGQYGESKFIQYIRDIERSGQKAVHKVRRSLGLLKNGLMEKIRNREDHSAVHHYKGYDEEIKYGLDTYQKVKDDGKKGNIIPPSNPEVSVVLPLSDDSGAFSRSLESVLNQEFEDYEVIVAGKRNSAVSATDIQTCDDPRVRIALENGNEKTAILWNHGMSEVRGDFIAFLRPGDVWKPAKLSRQLEVFKKASDRTGLVYTEAETPVQNEVATGRLPGLKGDVHKILLDQNIINCISSVIIRRTVIPAIGFFDIRLDGMEVHDYWLRISRFFLFDCINEPLVRCQTRHDSGSSKGSENRNNSKALFTEKHSREL